jgi:hypothetical protein
MSKEHTNPIVGAILRNWFSSQCTSAVARAMFTAALRVNK